MISVPLRRVRIDKAVSLGEVYRVVCGSRRKFDHKIKRLHAFDKEEPVGLGS